MWIRRANFGHFSRFGVTSMSQKQMTRGLLGASLLAAGACSHLPFHHRPAPASAPGPAPASAPAPAPVAQVQTARKPAPARPVKGPTDAEIAAVLLAASNTDISYARLAPTRAQSADTKDYAAQMATDHASVNRMVSEMLVRIKLNPEDNDASLAFRDESATRRDVLRHLDGHAFDVAYLMNEVTYHTKLLASIDNSLLPSARSHELKNLLTILRPAVAAHLAHAQELQASLASK
jgi:putative membrane protein